MFLISCDPGYFKAKKTLDKHRITWHTPEWKKPLQRVQDDDIMLWHRKSRTYAHKHADTQQAHTVKPSDYYTLRNIP